jgi:hypothetical protein
MQLTLQEVELRLKRWHTRLTRASNEVAKLEKKRRRMMSVTLADRPREHTKVRLASGEVVGVKTDSEIPLPELDAFFAAPSLPEKKFDAEDAFSIPKELKVTTDVERLRAERRKKEAAERKKMPLTGKAASDYIKRKK